MSLAPDTFATASREVLWNIPVFPDQIIFYLLYFGACGLFLYSILRRYFLWTAGKPATGRTGHWNSRFDRLWNLVACQQGVNRRADVRNFHSLIVWGFLVLTFTTTMVFIDHDLGIRIYNGYFYLVVTVLSDTFGLFVLLGVLVAYHRRYVRQPDCLHSTPADGVLLGVIAALVIQGFLLEGLRIYVTKDPWAGYSYVGYLTSWMFWSLSIKAAKLLHYVIWWSHSLTVFASIVIIPYSKFFHVLASSANLFFADFERPKGAMSYPGNLEKLLEDAVEKGEESIAVGVARVSDLTWKQRLDLDACTSCGRCQDACPAYNSGKPLSPKWLVLDTRNHLLKLHADGKLSGDHQPPGALAALDGELLNNLLVGVYSDSDPRAVRRAKNPQVQGAARAVGVNREAKLAGEVMDENVFWACTTCRACMEACPVGIEHLDLIHDVRRSQVLVEGNVPKEAQASLRAIETRGNPFGPREDRSNWTSGLNVPVLEAGAEVEILYWVGCVSAYDKRKQSIARSVANILNHSGLSWGILGNRECCTGDPARRLGDENIFQASAKQNVATLQSVKMKRIVANCPHCFHSLKNEYGELGDILRGGEVKIIHHSELIQELLATGVIKVRTDSEKQFTFHDPCYLGRYNDKYNEPRDVLVKIGSKVKEMPRSRENGFCCGAGGGHFFMDMKIGERVNVLRVEEAANTGADVVATACPFCMQMMEDGVKLTDREANLAVRDIAELVSENLIDKNAQRQNIATPETAPTPTH